MKMEIVPVAQHAEIRNGHHDADAAVTRPPRESLAEKHVSKEQRYWQNFYHKFDMDHPSQFCVLMATEIGPDRPVVEFGCGNGRDAIYLARHGFRVIAADLCAEAVRNNTEKEHGHDNAAMFCVCDVAVAHDVTRVMQLARQPQSPSPDDNRRRLTLYNRFFLHTLDEEQERKYLTTLSTLTRPGDRLYMEFRCSLDEKLDKVYGTGHYRRYINTDRLVDTLQALGFVIEYQVTGQGMAKYKSEDPFVSRVVAEKI